MMLRKLHELKKSEEGQTLVLAAVFGLVLMLCVLGTVNLGRAVYDKVQLQAAADSAAYSTAALEARVMNFTAYTNRAMVVHYASIMAATSYLTWIHFIWGGLGPLLRVLAFIPIVGQVIGVISQVLQALITVLDWGVSILTPLLSAANVILWGLQEGAWSSVWLQLTRSMQPEAHSGDSTQRPYVPIWPNLIPAANAAVFSLTRGHLTMPQNFVEAASLFINRNTDAVQEARLHMVEIANSARQPFVAYGDSWNSTVQWPVGRHWRLGFSFLNVNSVARTEMGTYKPTGGIVGGAKTMFPQIWSGQKAQLELKIPFYGTKRYGLLSFVGMDQLYTLYTPSGQNSFYALFQLPGGLVGIAIKALAPWLPGAIQAMRNSLKQWGPNPDQRWFWMSPYVYFAPQAKSTPDANPFSNKLGNFAQPDVLIGLALEGRYMNREPGASQTYGRKFSWNGGGAGAGAVDFSYTAKDWPTLPGIPRQVLHEGLNAFSAAQVYYHRPGDWKEMPNLFNPLWGARLMPVMESNALAKTTLAKVPLMSQLMMH